MQSDSFPRVRRLVRMVPGGWALGNLLRQLASPSRREIARLQEAEAERLFQPFPVTFEERYPDLFDALALRLGGLAQPRILSFGCSSGEEVRALSRRLPNARIVGLDLNRRAIASARKADPKGDYRVGSAPEAGERFDAVLAMAVFRHGTLAAERPDSCASILPFSRFAAGIAALDACIEPGGWLGIYHAQFRFCDTATFAHYEADPLTMADFDPQPLLYGPDDGRLDGVSEARVLFQKASTS